MILFLIGLTPLCLLNAVETLPNIYPATPVPFTEVEVNDGFWNDWINRVGMKFLPHNFQYCEKEKKIDNFRVAAGKMEGKHVGACFEDSDVYKVLEGAAYWLALHKDPAIEKQADEIIDLIAGAQQPDGYLNTYYTLVKPNERWTNDAEHETYCAGHLFEAAIAYDQATGKRKLLDVATKFADHIVNTFGPGKVEEVPQHEEIELALFKLAYYTQTEKYADLARWFIEQRGKPYKDKPTGRWDSQCQDHKPIIEQDEILGHAVRAMYLYSGVSDLVAKSGDMRYSNALDRLWHDLTERKMYITAGIGDSLLHIEGFSNPYYLPNDTAYCETCASIGLAFWAQRMFLLHRDAKYVDIIERAFYNTPLSGLALSADAIFYCNRLEGADQRPPWQGCACCPTNMVRFIPTIGGYAYSYEKDTLYILHYMPTKVALKITDGKFSKTKADGTETKNLVQIEQTTNYPWNGETKIHINTEQPQTFTIAIRIPDWCYRGAGSPERLYHFPECPGLEKVQLKINGEVVPIQSLDKGFVKLQREWKQNDEILLTLPMDVQRVYANEKVEADRGRVAIQKGPVVFCAEDVDNANQVKFLFMPRTAAFQSKFEPELLSGVVTIETTGKIKSEANPDGTDQPIKLIPYYAWANRQSGYMRVWIPETADLASIPSIETKATVEASHAWPNDSLSALNDQIEPKKSADMGIPRFTWWDHKGTNEWVQYNFDKEYTFKGVKVYWFDDTGSGECRVPESWEVLYLKDGKWTPVPNPSLRTTTRNRYNEVTFDPIKTTALRLSVQLQPDFSSGILEWKVIKDN